MAPIADTRAVRLPTVVALTAVALAAVAWIARPDNQLAGTRPSTLLAAAALVLGTAGILLGALESRRSAAQSAVAVIAGVVAVAAALGVLVSMAALPYGN